MGFQIGACAGHQARAARCWLRIRVGAGISAGLLAFAVAARADGTDDAAPSPKLSLGPGIYSSPQYPGASRARTEWFPFIDAEYGRFYSNAADLIGMYARNTPTLQAGAAIAFDPTERKPGDDPRLQYLPVIHSTARLKLFASRTIGFVTLEGSASTDMLGRGQGSLALGNLWFTAPLGPRLSINAGPGITWADAHFTRTFYAVTPQQASLSPGLTAYSTHAGVLDSHWNALAEWQIGNHLRIGAQWTFSRMRGDASDSPLTENRNQRTLTGWLAYKFR